MILKGFFEGLVNRPMETENTLTKSVVIDSSYSRPHCKAIRLSFMRIQFYIGFVLGLGNSINPSAIFFAIASVIIPAVYLQSLDVPLAHICNEILNIMPAIYYNDASTTISMITFVFLFITTFHYGLPNFKKRVSRYSMFSDFFFMETATTNSMRTPKMIYTYISWFAATIARTFCQIAVSPFNFMCGNNGKATILLSWLNCFRVPIFNNHKNSPYVLVQHYNIYLGVKL